MQNPCKVEAMLETGTKIVFFLLVCSSNSVYFLRNILNVISVFLRNHVGFFKNVVVRIISYKYSQKIETNKSLG